MNDLVKRLNYTIGAGVLGPGSSHHEYHVAESQVREAISLIKALARQNEKLEKEIAIKEEQLNLVCSYGSAKELLRLKKENEELRAALLKLQHHENFGEPHLTGDWESVCIGMEYCASEIVERLSDV